MLLVLLAFFVSTPLFETYRLQYPVTSLVFLGTILFTLRALEIHRRLFHLVCLIGGVVLALDLAYSLLSISILRTEVSLASLAFYAAFLFMSIILMLQKMFKSIRVTGDTIVGGISVYLLIGYFWTVIYYFIYILDNHAFYFTWSTGGMNLFYFSFTTMTTVGYGDVFPINKFAMVFSNLEAIVGQLYIAIFVARLIGLHIIHHHAENTKS